MCEIVTRDSSWYRAHMRLQKIGVPRYKAAQLATGYADTLGREDAWGFSGTRSSNFFADLGVEE